MVGVSNLWNGIVASVRSQVEGAYVISLPVISFRNSNTIHCFICPIKKNETSLGNSLCLGRPSHWVKANIETGSIIIYDCSMNDFCFNVGMSAYFTPFLCKTGGIEALNECLTALTNLMAEQVSDDDDIFSETKVNISNEQINTYNDKVLSLSEGFTHKIYEYLIKG